jgi:alkanesulfonate monooxygenase SsuD/methylene tetrahydromethanopterin reductase-like flavin-dependent oxidoreductase (luciferase family)
LSKSFDGSQDVEPEGAIMKIWHFSETAYPYLPPASEYESVRVDLPNRYYDPKKGAELFDRFIEEWQVAEEGGLEIMLNEHHQTPTCVDPAGPLLLAALARVTKTARLLILGNPVANRRQPVRVAEEMAFADILSHGRVEVGFVRGVPYEISPANANPVYTNERQWEALDLILKAWTSHDGPFSHEGRFFHARRVNIWPRPYQEPHPPIWVSSTSPDGAARVGARGFIQATFLTGYAATRPIFDGYRRGWRDARRGPDVPIDRLAYAAFVFTADSEARARAGAQELLWHIAINKIPPHFSNPPGYASIEANARALRAGISRYPKATSVDAAIELGIMFAGTPDQVLSQFDRFYDHVGGFGHLLVAGQSGFLSHTETVHGIKMLAREVFPKLRERYPDTARSGEVGHKAASAQSTAIPI